MRPRGDRKLAEASPSSVDVAIVGSGITGPVAAINLARAGCSVLVLDAEEAGHGASSRNAGYVGRTLKHAFGDIVDSDGLERAVRIYRELMDAIHSVKQTIDELGIDCRYRTWFGIRMARRLLGTERQASVFADRPLPSHPLYWGNPWFVPLAIRYLSRHDS